MNVELKSAEWKDQIFDVFQDHDIKQVFHVPDAGHSALEPGIRAALVNATESHRLSTSDTELFAPRFPWDA